MTIERIRIATEEAQQAFWGKVAEHFPEVKTGDFPPEDQLTFDDACERAISRWLYYNTDK